MSKLEIKALGAAGEVGRAAILVRSRETGSAVLLDYGVNFDANDRPVLPLHVRPRDVTCAVLSHAHLDHCGAFPSLYVSYEVPLYATPLTIELGDLLIKDLLKLSGYYLPYEHREVCKMLECTVPVTYGEIVEVSKDLTLTFLNAGHVPGSSMVIIDIDGWRVLYTGDFNPNPSALLNGADLLNIPQDVDVVIMEGTYTSGVHPPREQLEKQLIEIVLSVLEEGGCVLIPSFTVGRAQEVLTILVKYGIDYPIIVDGLARVANEIIARYPHYLRDYRLYKKAVETAIEVPSEYFRRNVGREPCIVISPAGMLKGGAVIQYFKKLSRNRRNAIILPSFQAPGTPGFQVLTRGRAVIENQEIKVEAKIFWLDLSAHAGKRELEQFILRFADRETTIVMVHTNLISALKFVSNLYTRHGVDNVVVPHTAGETLILDK